MSVKPLWGQHQWLELLPDRFHIRPTLLGLFPHLTSVCVIAGTARFISSLDISLCYCRTLVRKTRADNGDLILELLAGPGGLVFNYRSTRSLLSSVSLDEVLPLREWVHIVLQVMSTLCTLIIIRHRLVWTRSCPSGSGSTLSCR